MLYQRITPEAYLTSAVVYNRQYDQVVSTVTADKNTLQVYSPKQHEFYCQDCLDQGHAMRLVWTPQKSLNVPDRFRHHKYADATHICEHPVRYQKLNKLAVRYNAEAIGKHSYIFDADLDSDVVIDREDRIVDQASRVTKITEALIYDRGLSEGQQLRIGNFKRNFHDAVYDTSPADKLRLFRDSLAAARAQRDFHAAMIFRPIGNRGVWKEYTKYNAIPGYAGKFVDFANSKMQPSALLWCKEEDVYHQVRAITTDPKTNKMRPIIVYGRALLNLKTTYERAQAISREEKVPRAIYTTFVVNDAEQVSPWDYDAFTFEQAAQRHELVQAKAQKNKPGLFKPQMGLSL